MILLHDDQRMDDFEANRLRALLKISRSVPQWFYGAAHRLFSMLVCTVADNTLFS